VRWRRNDLTASRTAFAKWLEHNPLEDDQPFGASGAQYQVSRYCDYLGTTPWPRGNALKDASARDGAVNAYRSYLELFAPVTPIERVLRSLDHFYVFLGLGPVVIDRAPRTTSSSHCDPRTAPRLLSVAEESR
jgi:hypothetical protein